MKPKNSIATLRHLGRKFIALLLRRPQPIPPPRQLELELDELTATGLPLRDALPVKSAEYWLMLGQPHLAEQELQSLPESTRRHPWPLRVQLAAHHTHTH